MIVHRPKTARKVKNHHWHPWRFGYPICGTCGLLGLKNPFSQRAVNAPCPGWEED